MIDLIYVRCPSVYILNALEVLGTVDGLNVQAMCGKYDTSLKSGPFRALFGSTSTKFNSFQFVPSEFWSSLLEAT